MNRFFLWGIAIVIIGIGGWVVFSLGSQTPSPSDGTDTGGTGDFITLSAEDHFKGGETAPVVLVEYGDFQCPACGAYHPIVGQLEAEFGDQLKIVYRHFPLRRLHQNAESAARAAEAAALQGKFWEMHDLLFEQQQTWAQSDNAADQFASYAESLSLDVEKFKADSSSQEVIERVENNFQSGVAANVNGTPTFYLQGEKIISPQSYAEFQSVITGALQQSSGEPLQPVPTETP